MKSDFKQNVLDKHPIFKIIIGSHLLIENYLRIELQKKLIKPDALLTDNGPTFSELINICEATGTIQSDLAKVLRQLNRLRNKYAHRFSYVPTEKDVDAFLDILKKMESPFFISGVPGNENELGYAIASLCGYFQRTYGEL
ncbi:MAG: hypothetical protein HY755_12870 [Nitrospirae bacterium]|nr:hypothetical protein [Nitrospirota bacterium]